MVCGTPDSSVTSGCPDKKSGQVPKYAAADVSLITTRIKFTGHLF